MGPIKHKFYKYCVVPKCKSSIISCPEKLFFLLPKDEKIRKKWCIAIKSDEKENIKLSSTTSLYCCEDHFTFSEDMENYWQYKLVGNIQRLYSTNSTNLAGLIPLNSAPRKFRFLPRNKNIVNESIIDTIKRQRQKT